MQPANFSTLTDSLPSSLINSQAAMSPLTDPTQVSVGVTQASSLPPLALTPIASGINQPTAITHADDGSDRLFITERQGTIRVIQDGTLLPTPFLDITAIVGRSGGEQGLLGAAFPTDYANKGYFYVNYTNRSGDTVIARYRTSSPSLADPNSAEVLLTIDQPFSNHNGGQLAFGPDGYLYIGMGDGGSAGDPQGNAQNPASLLGKMLRIDVESGAATYTIPDNNPFVGANDPTDRYRDEIWASGLRNPWRFSFDRLTGELFIADVGQSTFEEINYQSATSQGGENYGWNIMEGFSRYNNNPGDLTGLVNPIGGYDHAQGSSITGGFVYRGPVTSFYQGVYFYADFINGRIWGLQRESTGWASTLLVDTPYNISTFGEDEAGNLYVADFSEGGIYRLEIAATTSDRNLIWRNATTGINTAWLLNSSNYVGAQSLPEVVDANWKIVTISDFNQDQNSDLIWRNAATGENAVWFMNGATPVEFYYLPTVSDLNWQIVGANDFNRDGQGDLLWRNEGTGENVIWLMNGTTITTSQWLPQVESSWTIAGMADFNNDTQVDLFWRNPLSGENAIWLMNGARFGSASMPQVVGANWSVAGVYDWNQDGTPDLIWRDTSTGENVVWLINNATLTNYRSLPSVADPNWKIAGITDFNSDGKGDLLWQNLKTGENLIWLLDDTTLIATEYLPTLANPNWQVWVFA